uniref:Threonyl-tRNA synthetase 1 n=2 Tax=Equus TaxID=9789 RepID=A0A5F5PXX9_HORSE
MSEEKASSPSGKMGGEEKPVCAGEEKRKEGGKKSKEGSGDGGRAEGSLQVLFLSASPGLPTDSVCS